MPDGLALLIAVKSSPNLMTLLVHFGYRYSYDVSDREMLVQPVHKYIHFHTAINERSKVCYIVHLRSHHTEILDENTRLMREVGRYVLCRSKWSQP